MPYSSNAYSQLWLRLLLSVYIFCGAYFLIGGTWLIVVGGSWFYALMGAMLIGTAYLLYNRKAAALTLYTALLLLTLVWALWECGLDFWALAPRVDVVGVLGLLLILPAITRILTGNLRTPRIALGGTLALGALVFLSSTMTDPHDTKGSMALDNDNRHAVDTANKDWKAWGGTGAGDHFSGLNEITPDNVHRLKLAWQFQTGDLRRPTDSSETTYESTPLKIDDTLYTCSPHQIVYALDAATGTLKWKFDPKSLSLPQFQHLTCRGVSYHETKADAVTTDGSPAPTDCAKRIIFPTADARMLAIDAITGERCKSFGENGEISLKQFQPVTTPGFSEGTSPPVVTDKLIVMGGSVIDNWSTHSPSGAIQAFDVYTGKLVWVFDAGNHDPNEMPSETHKLTPASPNAWTILSVDEKLGMVYVPLGTQDPDIWGGNRTPDMERYDSAIVALDLNTGKLQWSFQNVHHDLWDMDFPSQASLVDVTTAEGVVPTIYVPAKTGNIFVLDRRTGKLIVPAPETKVPSGPAPGDRLSPTQPFSALSFRPKEKLTGADMWGATAFDQLLCRIKFHSLRYEGPFTPPTVKGTLVYPGDFGMFEWGGIGVDPIHQIAIANPSSIPFVQHLIPRGPKNPSEPGANLPAGNESGVQPMFGTPFGVNLDIFLSPFGMPCMAPPWGYIAGIDLKTNKVVWQHRVGTTRDSSPFPITLKVGTPMLGGPLVTNGGVAFLTSTLDQYIRAFDVKTGKMLWQDRLLAGGQSNPMSYEVNGEQYIVTVDGGHQSFGTKMGDYIRAYKLEGSKNR
ncbi:membrane-bound PQQ-dependent dehydrogenase, glucose/quinate/shikimate family [Gluconobacter kondonii]|uniref:membrane-bound PQQ-dependent dehydrogenase, glucose/quinate/shikimate family n=1 Tax=Gluconobacter kondonii TaxID=941463 RepID=UPI0034253946